jgi:hypothetical protein
MLMVAIAVSLTWASSADSDRRSSCQVGTVCRGVKAYHVQAQQSPAATGHVRTLNPHLLVALNDGMTRSRTLRQLAATLDASDVVVYLDEGVCSDAAACTMIAGTSNDVRWLRTNFVLRTPTGATSLLCHRDQLIAQIGHELQHAVEIANHAGVNDERTLAQLYGRIGRRRARFGLRIGRSHSGGRAGAR